MKALPDLPGSVTWTPAGAVSSLEVLLRRLSLSFGVKTQSSFWAGVGSGFCRCSPPWRLCLEGLALLLITSVGLVFVTGFFVFSVRFYLFPFSKMWVRFSL